MTNKNSFIYIFILLKVCGGIVLVTPEVGREAMLPPGSSKWEGESRSLESYGSFGV